MPAPVLRTSASPERLDQRITVVGPGSWILAVSIAIVIAAVGVWGFFGTVVTKVGGQGILVNARGPDIGQQAVYDGEVEEVLVSPGDRIAPGQVLRSL